MSMYLQVTQVLMTSCVVKGGITFIKAPRGTGKTEVIRYFETGLEKHLMYALPLLHMEEMKSTPYRAMATYEGVQCPYKDDARENNISEERVIEALKDATRVNVPLCLR